MAMYNAKELFDIKNNIDETHPKIQALMSTLLEKGITENSHPCANISILLQISINKEIGT